MDALLIGWFVITLAGTAWMAFDLYTHTPAMRMMKPGWILVALYTGPIGVAAYVLTCRQPGKAAAPDKFDAHDAFIKPLWRQAMGSLVHCLAGDATGVIVAATFASLLGLVGIADAALEYALGFIFGLFIFQALFMKSMLGGYWPAVKKTIYVEWVSMNWVMAGMIPVVMVGKSMLPEAEHATSMDYWFVMQIGAIVGLALGYPVNYWLVGKGLKHGMMTERPQQAAGEMQHEHDHTQGHHHPHAPATMASHEHMHHAVGSGHESMTHQSQSHAEHESHAMHAGHAEHAHIDSAVAGPVLAIVAMVSLIALAFGVGLGFFMVG